MQSVSEFQSGLSANAIVTTAPCRADLAGGTLDIWPLYLFHPGAVSVNVALNILTLAGSHHEQERALFCNRTTPRARSASPASTSC